MVLKSECVITAKMIIICRQAGAELSQAQLNWRLALLEWWLGSESDKIFLKYIF